MPQYQHARFCVSNSAVATWPHCLVYEFCIITLQLLGLLRYPIFNFYFAKGGDIAYGCSCVRFLSSVAKIQV